MDGYMCSVLDFSRSSEVGGLRGSVMDSYVGRWMSTEASRQTASEAARWK